MEAEEPAKEVDTPLEDAASVDETVDSILTSTRTGKALQSYEAVYADPSVQEALTSGDDVEARGKIKEKLCKLGYTKDVSVSVSTIEVDRLMNTRLFTVR